MHFPRAALLASALCAGCAAQPQRVVLAPDTAPAVDPALARASTAAPAGTPSPAQGILPDDVWQRVRNGFALPDLDSPLVAEHAAWYAARPGYVARITARSRRYLHHVVEAVEKRGLPTEIALLPVIESAYNPTAYSRSHASGLWQFIPSTGRHYGLEQHWWYDMRRDIIASTEAALDYLEQLYAVFGDWQLALAAYNLGEGALNRAIAANLAIGAPTDYPSLELPAETRNYVPKLTAVKRIVMDPEAYGLTLEPIPNQSYFGTVNADQPIDAALAARLAEIAPEEFRALNPAHNRPVIHPDGVATLLLPAANVVAFTQNLAKHSGPLVSWQGYRVRRGEGLRHIARRFGTTVGELCQTNGLSPGKRLRGGELLLVPFRADTSWIISARHAAEAGAGTHTVARGDTLFGIAQRHGVTVQQLQRWNGLASAHIRPGDTLRIGPPFPIAGGAPRPDATRYTVRPGDTLHAIARRFRVSVEELLHSNGRSPGDPLHPGDTITVPSPQRT